MKAAGLLFHGLLPSGRDLQRTTVWYDGRLEDCLHPTGGYHVYRLSTQSLSIT